MNNLIYIYIYIEEYMYTYSIEFAINSINKGVGRRWKKD